MSLGLVTELRGMFRGLYVRWPTLIGEWADSWPVTGSWVLNLAGHGACGAAAERGASGLAGGRWSHWLGAAGLFRAYGGTATLCRTVAPERRGLRR